MPSSVILDASPLIVLLKSDLISQLPQLFESTFVPDSVYSEVLAGPENDAARSLLPTLDWLVRIDPVTIPSDILEYDLGTGESEVLTIARNTKGSVAMIDDAAARSCAMLEAIPFIGTGGMLLQAKQRGLINSLSAALQSVEAAGLWISPHVTQLLIRRAGEG